MHNLSAFGVGDMMGLRATLRSLDTAAASTLEDAARAMVDLFREQLVDAEGRSACPLVRIYKTHPYALLGDDLRRFAQRIDPQVDRVPDVRCLVLLASRGDEPGWNDRRLSRGHQAIPLTNERAVAGAPMIVELIAQLGLDISMVVRPSLAHLLDVTDTAQNVFFVPDVPSSPVIPAQADFVAPYGIRSVIGFGGLVSSGDLFAAILFSRVPILPAVADLFKVIGLNFKLGWLPLAMRPLFRGD